MESLQVECQGAVWETRNVLRRSFSHLQCATRALEALTMMMMMMMSCIVTCQQQGDAEATDALHRVTPV